MKPLKNDSPFTYFYRLFKPQNIFYAFIFFFSIGIAAYSLILPWLGFTGPIHKRLFELPSLFFYMHTIGGAIALILAPLQLFKQKRRSRHKLRGYAYVVAVTASALSGLYLAQDAYGGVSSTLALSILSTLWLVSTYKGVYAAVKIEVFKHQKWMLRSAALTFAAITLRLISPILYTFYSLYDAQQIIYWSCWILNLIIVECFIFFYLGRRSIRN